MAAAGWCAPETGQGLLGETGAEGRKTAGAGSCYRGLALLTWNSVTIVKNGASVQSNVNRFQMSRYLFAPLSREVFMVLGVTRMNNSLQNAFIRESFVILSS